MAKENNLIYDKSLDFAVRIVNLYKFLREEKHETVISKQILRSGTSIGANVNEAFSGESTQDFIHKMQIAQKECNETAYWIEVLYRTAYIDERSYCSVKNDADEVRRIIVSIILTAKQRLKDASKNNS